MMTVFRRWWRWAFGVSFIPALALAQTVGDGADVRERPAAVERHIQPDAVVIAPAHPPTLAQNFRESEKPPAPNERIPVRKNFQPEMHSSMLDLD